MNAVEARVRNTFNTYTASVKGQKSTPTMGAFPSARASCTAGPEHAAAAVARKVFGDRLASVIFVRREGDVEIWRIAA